MWTTIDKAAQRMRTTPSTVRAMTAANQLMTMPGDDGSVLVWTTDNPRQTDMEQQPGFNRIELQPVPASKITDGVIATVNALLRIVNAGSDIAAVESAAAAAAGANVNTLRRYRTELRRMFSLPKRCSLSVLATHPQLRQACETIAARGERSDKCTLRGARTMSVLVARGGQRTGESISLEEYAIALYAHPHTNARGVYLALRAEADKGSVIAEEAVGTETRIVPVAADLLPSYSAVNRFLRAHKRDNLALARARMQRKEWDNFNIHVTRNPEEYRVRGHLEGDHTELDVEVINSNTGKIDRLWMTSFVDYNSGLIAGYWLTYRPNSLSIALAARNAVTGSQLHAKQASGYVALPEPRMDVPDRITIDNGKDYRSRFTQAFFGKIDFEDEARRTIQRITELHYTQPYHGQSKPHVERSYGVINAMLKYLPGYTGSYYRVRPDALKEEKRNGQLLSDVEFAGAVAQAVDAYNNHPLRDRQNRTPVELYLMQAGQHRLVDARVLDFLMMKTTTPRVIRRGHIAVDGVDYCSAALQKYHNRHCVVYWDPSDRQYAHVYIDGEYIATATALNLEGRGMTQEEAIHVIQERARLEKYLREEGKKIRQGMTRADVKAAMWSGVLGNTHPVDDALLNEAAKTPMLVLTGVEQQARELQTNLVKVREAAAAEEKRKKRVGQRPLDLAAVNERIS